MFAYRKIYGLIILTVLLIVLAGCATKRDLVIVDEKINNIRADQKEMKEKIDRLDSLFFSETEESTKLRAEIRSSIDALMEQFRVTQASLGDIQSSIAMIPAQGKQPIFPPVTGTGSTTDSTGAAAAVPGIDCQALYDESFINVRRGQYEESVQGFREYLKYCGTQDLADNARFWIGEALYSMEKYNDAITEFSQLIKDYPNSEKRAGSLYKIARSYEELGQKTEAKNAFRKLVDEYPGTLEAQQAQEKLKELK
jgi:tol-pal system protein YbgF